MTTPVCKLCAGQTAEKLRVGADRRPGVTPSAAPVPYYACGACGFLFATHLDAPEAELLYEDDYFGTTDLGASRRAELPHQMAMQLAKWLGRSPEPVLDFGSGTGRAVARMREAGLEAYGVDIVAPEVAAEFIRVGLLDDESRYGLVTAIEVFEHLPDPIAAASAIGRSLKPGGLLAMTTELHDPATLQPDWWYLAPGAGHISLYTAPALEALAARTGFHVLYTTPTNHYWIKGPLPAWRLVALRARLHGARALDKVTRRLRRDR